MKLAVYGTLRKGQSRHGSLDGFKYIGEYNTLPEFKLLSVNDNYPALLYDGHTSVTMEVYECTLKQIRQIDQIEGFDSDDKENSLYLRKVIRTPFGRAVTYIYNDPDNDFEEITTGDWVDFMNRKNAIRQIQIEST